MVHVAVRDGHDLPWMLVQRTNDSMEDDGHRGGCRKTRLKARRVGMSTGMARSAAGAGTCAYDDGDRCGHGRQGRARSQPTAGEMGDGVPTMA